MDQAGYVWPHMVRMRVRGGEEKEAYGPLESEGEIESVNQSFLYLVNKCRFYFFYFLSFYCSNNYNNYNYSYTTATKQNDRNYYQKLASTLIAKLLL